MSAIHGRTGSISIAGAATDLNAGGAHALLANGWSGSIDRDTHDVTPFNPTSAAKKNIGGLHVMTGSISGFLDGTAPHVIAAFTSDEDPVAFVLTSSTNRTYSFNGVLSNFSPTVGVQAVNTWSASFISDGVIAIA